MRDLFDEAAGEVPSAKSEGAYVEPDRARKVKRVSPMPEPCFTPEEIAKRRKIEPHMLAVSSERPELPPIERWRIATERATAETA